MLYPLELIPVVQDYLWGGTRLATDLGKPLPVSGRVAESWEIVDHRSAQSTVSRGPIAKMTLEQIRKSHPDQLFGRDASHFRADASRRFPLLLKYLDCQQVLSVQVHPDDAYASGMSPPDLGKTEAWYVIDAAPGSKIYAGLKTGVSRSDLATAVATGQTERVLHSFSPRPGDCVFVPAGTVHALGEGLLIAEIQQSSNTTFRLFDWNRLDSNGLSRPLHLQQALEVTDYQRGPISPVASAGLSRRWQSLVDCERFRLWARHGTGEVVLEPTDAFAIVTVPRGEARLTCNDQQYLLPAGRSLLLPACVPACHLSLLTDQTTILLIRPPNLA